MFLPCGNGWTANNSGPSADCDAAAGYDRQLFCTQTIVIGLGGALCVWGGVNLLEGYGQDNPASNAHVS